MRDYLQGLEGEFLTQAMRVLKYGLRFLQEETAE